MFGATVLIPFIVGGAMKLPPEELALMISTIFFTSGLCTLIQQSALGNKLPVIQGGTFSFLGPTFAFRFWGPHLPSSAWWPPRN
jgi:nucleobase transporter 1/2